MPTPSAELPTATHAAEIEADEVAGNGVVHRLGTGKDHAYQIPGDHIALAGRLFYPLMVLSWGPSNRCIP